MMTGKNRILVVDDTPENVYVLKEILEEGGFEVIESFDGKNALNMALSYKPDLIICDIMMPDVNGYQVAEQLQKNPYTETIPIIFLSAKTDPKDIRTGMALGVDDYITKPVNSDDLIRSIKIRLKRREVYRKELNEIRKSLTNALPHELQTPLTSILGFSEILIEEYKTMDRESIFEMAQNVHTSALRLNELVQKVLLISKLNLLANDPAGAVNLKKHSTKMTEKIIKNSAFKKAGFFKREDDLKLDIKPAALKISDIDLKKIVDELADNAFKYSQKGDKVDIVGSQAGLSYNIFIIDHGIGMTDEQISRIGDFMQYDRLMYERTGTGLGLSIAKKITELYGGELAIESIPAKQTMVRVTLPLSGGKVIPGNNI